MYKVYLLSHVMSQLAFWIANQASFYGQKSLWMLKVLTRNKTLFISIIKTRHPSCCYRHHTMSGISKDAWISKPIYVQQTHFGKLTLILQCHFIFCILIIQTRFRFRTKVKMKNGHLVDFLYSCTFAWRVILMLIFTPVHSGAVLQNCCILLPHSEMILLLFVFSNQQIKTKFLTVLKCCWSSQFCQFAACRLYSAVC